MLRTLMVSEFCFCTLEYILRFTFCLVTGLKKGFDHSNDVASKHKVYKTGSRGSVGYRNLGEKLKTLVIFRQ